jgi:maltose alpha-D-glucosyltransferase / alpha-amylase
MSAHHPERATPIELSDWKQLLQPPACRTLESEVLPEWLCRQRWFGAKTRTVAGARIVDAAWLSHLSTPAALTLLQVSYVEDSAAPDTYLLPLAIATGTAQQTQAARRPEGVLCPLRANGEEGLLLDGVQSDVLCRFLLEAIARRQELPAREGVFSALPTTAFPDLDPNALHDLDVQRGSAEQSNTSVIFGGRFILKLFRRLERGPNPDFEIGRFLTEKAHFEHIPACFGGILYHFGDAEAVNAAMLQPLVANQGDGWKATLRHLAQYFERVSSFGGIDPKDYTPATSSLLERASTPTPPAMVHLAGDYLPMVRLLGQRTAEMHLALAKVTGDPAFDPEPLDREALEKIAATLRQEALLAFETLRQNFSSLPPEVLEPAQRLLDQRQTLLRRLERLHQIEPSSGRIRVHGDYHLGQVLWTGSDFVLLDFEGEPARPLHERRRKQPPLKDVAGMLRSFSYAAFAGLPEGGAAAPAGGQHPLEPWALLWENWVAAEFLGAYRRTAGSAQFLTAEPFEFGALLDAFLLEKALYELTYELNNRPAWVHIPLRGIMQLI